MNKYKLITLLMVLVFILSSCSKKEPIVTRDFMMDTVVTFQIYEGKDKESIDKAKDEALSFLEAIENQMSIYKEDSEVTQINKNSGLKAVKVSENLYELIKESRKIAELSEGAYDPSIGPLVELWDIKAGERDESDLPSSKEIDFTKDLVDYRNIKLLDDNKVLLEEEGMKLDLGAIAKGYAADKVRDIFMENGISSAIIDLGGNIYLLGEKDKDEPWNIGIQDPLDENAYLAIINLKDKTIVTSGDYERYFEIGEKRYHHIIDPYTGSPSEKDLLSVSIIGDNSMLADALSTTIFVLGQEEGIKFMEENYSDYQYVLVNKEKEVIIKNIDEDSFKLTNDEYKLRILQWKRV